MSWLNAALPMPTRPAHKLVHSLVRALAFAILLTGAVQADESVELTLEQARAVSVAALQNGDPGLAIQVAKGLLKANPRDPIAYFVLAQAHAGLNQPNLARRAAAYAYRYSQTGPARFQAAQLAARMAFEEGKPSLAQVWLRRTAIHAPSEQAEKLVARDYRTLRAINPWSFRLRTDLRPSNNVNNGADTSLQIIDGVPVTGILSGSARALSGVIGVLDIASAYRLRADANSATSLGGRLYVQRVGLSGDAKALAPNANNSDFASTYAEISLRHGFAVGAPGKKGTAAVELAFGESWYGGARSYRFGRIRAQRNWLLAGGRTRLLVRAVAENRNKARYRSNDARILGLGAEIKRVLGNGDSLGVTMAFRDSVARHHNGTFTSASMRTSYTFAKPVGPARLSAGLIMGYSDYPVYRSGLFLVPGGRQDKSVYGELSLFFDRYDYAGFAPMLRFRTGRKSSNDSRFDTRELSLTLSVQSKF